MLPMMGQFEYSRSQILLHLFIWIILTSSSDLLARPLCAKRRRGRLIFCWCFVIFFTQFSDICQTNYLNIYWTDLHEIFTIDRTLVVGECLEDIVFDPSRELAAVTNFVGKIDLLVARHSLRRRRRHTTRRAIAMQGAGKQITWFDGCRRTN